MLLILKDLKNRLRFSLLSFPDLIGESREREWIIRSSRIMTTMGTEFAMNYKNKDERKISRKGG
jgi:hypothetical protein